MKGPKNKVIFHQGVKEVRPISSRKDISLMVDEVDGDDAQVWKNEENVRKPEQDLEQSQATVEPESVISEATIRVFHQDESEI